MQQANMKKRLQVLEDTLQPYGQGSFLMLLETIHGRDLRHKLAVAHNLAFQFAAQFPMVGEVEHDATTQVHSKPIFFPVTVFTMQYTDAYKRIDLEEGMVIDIPMEIGVNVPKLQIMFFEIAVETTHHIKTVVNVIQYATAKEALTAQNIRTVTQIQANAPFALLGLHAD